MPGVPNIAVHNRLIRHLCPGMINAGDPPPARSRLGVKRITRVPHLLRYGLAFSLLFVAGVTTACAPRDVYPIHQLEDRRLWAIQRRVFWLDEQTLAFAARSAVDGERAGVDIYLWRPGKGGEKLYRRNVWRNTAEALQGWFCEAEGRLGYNISPGSGGLDHGGVAFRLLEGPPDRLEQREVVSYFLPAADRP